jgi:hypothetical protein
MELEKPKDGAPGTTEQSPRWEGPQGSKPGAYLNAKDDPETEKDSLGENLNDPKVRTVSDGMKTKK